MDETKVVWQLEQPEKARPQIAQTGSVHISEAVNYQARQNPETLCRANSHHSFATRCVTDRLNFWRARSALLRFETPRPSSLKLRHAKPSKSFESYSNASNALSALQFATKCRQQEIRQVQPRFTHSPSANRALALRAVNQSDHASRSVLQPKVRTCFLKYFSNTVQSFSLSGRSFRT